MAFVSLTMMLAIIMIMVRGGPGRHIQLSSLGRGNGDVFRSRWCGTGRRGRFGLRRCAGIEAKVLKFMLGNGNVMLDGIWFHHGLNERINLCADRSLGVGAST